VPERELSRLRAVSTTRNGVTTTRAQHEDGAAFLVHPAPDESPVRKRQARNRRRPQTPQIAPDQVGETFSVFQTPVGAAGAHRKREKKPVNDGSAERWSSRRPKSVGCTKSMAVGAIFQSQQVADPPRGLNGAGNKPLRCRRASYWWRRASMGVAHGKIGTPDLRTGSIRGAGYRGRRSGTCGRCRRATWGAAREVA
jgi:hypothetical protein